MTAGVLVCLAAAGCGTVPAQREVEVVFDCPRQVATSASAPPTTGPDRSPALDINDARVRAYFSEIKQRVYAAWVYPKAAAQQGQSGSGQVVFMVFQNGRIGHVDVVRSTGTEVLDRYLVNAIRLASPFPPLPCKITEDAIPVTFTFDYFLKDDPRRGFQP